MEDEKQEAAEYERKAEEMREAAEHTFDPGLAASYLSLAVEWLRLAEDRRNRGGNATAAELRAERDRLASMVAAQERDGALPGNPQTGEAQRSFLEYQLSELDRQISSNGGKDA